MSYPEIEAYGQAIMEPPEVYLRVNTSRTTPEELAGRLGEAGVTAESTYVPGVLSVSSSASIFSNDLFRAGLYYAQDISGAICSYALGARGDSKVLDLCAAPGGKSFGAWLSSGGAQVKAADIDTKKIDTMRRTAVQLGIPVTAVKRDATVLWESEAGAYGFVVCDVPCSGLGALRRKPEILGRLTADHAASLPPLQSRILASAYAYARPGGVVLYSTCTLGKRENEDVVEKFLAGNPGARLEAVSLPFGLNAAHPEMADGILHLGPERDHSDGFFIARIRKGD
jgi:16S rRNA (cytosine967-C5)-methyltransferase